MHLYSVGSYSRCNQTFHRNEPRTLKNQAVYHFSLDPSHYLKFATDGATLLSPRLKAFGRLPLGIRPSSVCLGAVHGSQLYKNIYSSRL